MYTSSSKVAASPRDIPILTEIDTLLGDTAYSILELGL